MLNEEEMQLLRDYYTWVRQHEYRDTSYYLMEEDMVGARLLAGKGLVLMENEGFLGLWTMTLRDPLPSWFADHHTLLLLQS